MAILSPGPTLVCRLYILYHWKNQFLLVLMMLLYIVEIIAGQFSMFRNAYLASPPFASSIYRSESESLRSMHLM